MATRTTPVAFGADIGGTTIHLGLVDPSWAVRWRMSMPTRAHAEPEAVLGDVVEAVTKASDDLGLDRTAIRGIGVGLPGVVDAERGVAGKAANLPGWEGFGVTKYLADRLDIRSRLDHDVRVMTRGEMLCGAARGLRDFVLVAIGTGVGMSVVVNGEIYRRSTGDLGHMTIDHRGRRCPCGGAGCLERYVSGPALAAEVRRTRRGSAIDLPVQPEEVAEQARAGRPWAGAVFDRLGRYLGLALCNVVAMLNPEVVIIGGGLARAGRLLLDPAIDVLEERAFMFTNPRDRIWATQLGDDAGVIGAASLILDDEGL